MQALGLSGLADRIDEVLPLLESRDVRAAARHRSLAAVAEWSVRLLADDAVLNSLSSGPPLGAEDE